MPVFVEFLRRLHNGPPQAAAAVRVAMAIWQQATERGDLTQAHEALDLARMQLDALIAELTRLQETGRRWSGNPTPTHADLAGAAAAAERWEASLQGAPPPLLSGRPATGGNLPAPRTGGEAGNPGRARRG